MRLRDLRMGYFLSKEEEYDELRGQRRARSGRIAPSDEVTRSWKRVSGEKGAVRATELIQSTPAKKQVERTRTAGRDAAV
jgi:hypothetical protein